ncbi:MAG: TetR/AcrR family transcriptional regulator [Gordonia polyisoprenivorans]|nr:TetR/AcrR family transcriptional regulator [Gordonia polyisoprenivorans]
MPAQALDISRRDAILAAALALFDADGYAVTTMSAVQRAARASTGSLYHHFPSKAHLAAELQVRALTDYRDGLLTALGNGDADDAEGGVRAVVHFHLRWVTDNLDRARLLYTLHDPQVSELAAERIEAVNTVLFDDVGSWYERQRSSGRVRDVPIHVLSSVWIGPAQEIGRTHLTRQYDPTGVLEFADDLATAAWHALRA